METQHLLEIYPIVREKRFGILDYRFACFLPEQTEQERFQVLDFKTHEAFLLTSTSGAPVIGVEYKDRRRAFKKPLEKKADISHYSFKVYGKDYEMVARIVEVAQKEHTTSLLCGLISCLVKIGLKILYKREKGIKFDEAKFCDEQIMKYFRRFLFLDYYYLDLQKRIFIDEQEEIQFINLFLGFGLSMKDVAPLQPAYFEN